MRTTAYFIVKTLQESGFTAYYAGGYVRDLVMNQLSKDIDIATNAAPEEVMELFPKTIPLGKAFGVVMVVIDEKAYEVASFRKDELYIDGRRPTAITLSTPQEDALRRDFTINGLFFDPITLEFFDYVEGKADIERGIVRAIGNPYERFKEDRLRMIRAVRFCTKLNFSLEPKTREAIIEYADKLYPAVAKERVWQEIKKMGTNGHFKEALLLLNELHLLKVIFPECNEKLLSTLPSLDKPLSPLLYIASIHDKSCIETLLDLKISNQELSDYLFIEKFLPLIRQKEMTPVDWVAYFAHPLSSSLTEFTSVEEEIKLKEIFYSSAIERKKNNTTLLQAKDLLERGVIPGPSLGALLKNGEEVAITENLQTKEELLKRLGF